MLKICRMRFPLMNKKFFVLLFAVIFVLNSVSATSAQTKKVAYKKNTPSKILPKQTNSLAALLPNSDAVINIQMSRLMSEALPQILAAKPQSLQEFNGKIDEIKNNTGIDLRQFDQIAVGVAYKIISAKETDFDPVILAQGKFNANAFLGLAKVAAKGKYREEKIGEKTIYVFLPKEVLADNKANVKNSSVDKLLDQLMKSFTKEIAVTAYNDNTLAMGSVNRVRDAFESTERVNNSLLELVSKSPNAMLSFGANMPNGASQFIKIDNDEIGKNIEAIKQMCGAIDFNKETKTKAGKPIKPGKATLYVTAATDKVDDAQGLEETLLGLQMVGKALLGGSNRADQKLYSRLLENAVIARKSTEVSLNLAIPKNDMDALMAILLK